ncbi:MAG TPA: sulfite exporter TauE/SafE family protein [Xanthobacteraceae bacterium]|nr:sulfite exporter TauE/SafE family protein [Xanthobacteraceae bacterium]
MDFLFTPEIGPLLFAGLSLASFISGFIGVFTGAAGGVLLLALMAMVVPPTVVIPVHTVVMLGTGAARTMIMWRHVMRGTLLPFVIGSVIGAALGANVFVALPINWLQAILGGFILLVTWMPKLGRLGAEGGRFAFLGFGATFLGVFVSATGTLLAPFVASASPNRYNHAATLGALMLISHTAKVAAFGFIGFAIGSFVPLMVAMVLAGALGNWLGEVALDYTSEGRFRLILQLVLTALGLRLIWMAAPELGLF